MKHWVITVLALAALSGFVAHAQDPRASPDSDPVAEQIFPPELILKHQQTIGLTDAQRATLISELKRAQGELVEPQVQMQSSVEQMVQILKSDRVDEQKALAQLDLVLASERSIKRQHLALAVRLKNLLTAEQIQQLRAIRAGAPSPK